MNLCLKFFVLVSVLIGSVAQAAEISSLQQQGIGVVKVTPDEGYIYIDVQVIAPKSSDALKTGDALVRKLVADLKEKSLGRESIQTLNFQIGEHFKIVNNEQKKDGFILSHNILVTVCDMSKFVDVIDLMADISGISIRNIKFGSSKAKEKQDEALKLALADARRKAAITAKELGVELGAILRITSGSSVRENAYYDSAPSGMRSESSIFAGNGATSFSAIVNVDWEILHVMAFPPPAPPAPPEN